MIVKVCGMREPDNIRAVDELGIDLIGFILYTRSPRYFSGEPPQTRAKRVAVMVNPTDQELLNLADRYYAVQLHGDETPQRCREVAAQTGCKVFKALSISTEQDAQRAARFEGACEMLLFDTKCEGRGGSGVQFDWTLLHAYTGHTPFLLSGGLAPDDYSRLAAFSHPRYRGIDLNSRFEDRPGLKNIELLCQFLHHIQP